MSLLIRLRNANREPFQDRADIEVTDVRTDRIVDRKTNVSTFRPARADNVQAGGLYKVRVFPSKHRPVGQFVRVPGSGKSEIELHCPLHPDRVDHVEFPDFDVLDPELRSVLERNGVEDHPQTGMELYDSLGDLEKAGLLNVWTKMRHTPLAEEHTVSHYMDTLYRVRGDRFFATVSLSLRDLIKTSVAAGGFEEVSGALHTPPPGFVDAGSFKTKDGYGNLQLTFFASIELPLRFKVDADIDDAQGIEHVFQVLRNWLTGGETHPYDIHQILTFHQQLDPGYRLIA